MHHVPAAVPPTRRRIRLALCIVAGFGHGNAPTSTLTRTVCSRKSDCPIPQRHPHRDHRRPERHAQHRLGRQADKTPAHTADYLFLIGDCDCRIGRRRIAFLSESDLKQIASCMTVRDTFGHLTGM
jgi:hypothetical protein